MKDLQGLTFFDNEPYSRQTQRASGTTLGPVSENLRNSSVSKGSTSTLESESSFVSFTLDVPRSGADPNHDSAPDFDGPPLFQEDTPCRAVQLGRDCLHVLCGHVDEKT